MSKKNSIKTKMTDDVQKDINITHHNQRLTKKKICFIGSAKVSKLVRTVLMPNANFLLLFYNFEISKL